MCQGERVRSFAEALLDSLRNVAGPNLLTKEVTWSSATYLSNGTLAPRGQWAMTSVARSTPNFAAAAILGVLVGTVAQGAAGEGGDAILALGESLHNVSAYPTTN